MEKVFISSSFSAILTLPSPQAKGENEQDCYIKTKYRTLPFFLYVLKIKHQRNISFNIVNINKTIQFKTATVKKRGFLYSVHIDGQIFTFVVLSLLTFSPGSGYITP